MRALVKNDGLRIELASAGGSTLRAVLQQQKWHRVPARTMRMSHRHSAYDTFPYCILCEPVNDTRTRHKSVFALRREIKNQSRRLPCC